MTYLLISAKGIYTYFPTDQARVSPFSPKARNQFIENFADTEGS